MRVRIPPSAPKHRTVLRTSASEQPAAALHFGAAHGFAEPLIGTQDRVREGRRDFEGCALTSALPVMVPGATPVQEGHIPPKALTSLHSVRSETPSQQHRTLGPQHSVS